MLKSGEKLGAFIIPTGVGASIGGYAGDASAWARKFAKYSKLIVNPNVVNAGGFSGITENMLYVEGYSLDSFFKGDINLNPSSENKIGIVFDKAIPQNILNIHINTINAVKTVYDLNIVGYELTEQDVGVEFFMTDIGMSLGNVNNQQAIKVAAQKLLKKGANAIAIVCMFDDPFEDNLDYINGIGTDPVGGVEAIISHYISSELKVPCAHAPAFEDFSAATEIVNPKSAAEYITPTFLPCILLGLANAPLIGGDININQLDFLIMPYDCLGSTPVFESIKKNIPIFAVSENKTALNVSNQNFYNTENISVVRDYQECLNLIIKC